MVILDFEARENRLKLARARTMVACARLSVIEPTRVSDFRFFLT